MKQQGSGTPAYYAARANAVRTSVLRAAFTSAGGQTRLGSKYHTAPIKIAKAFPLNQQLGVIVMDVSPGLLSGDRYELEWTAAADSHVMITNQSYMKVHPSMPHAGSSMLQRFELAERAVVEHMPEPMMLYKDAALHNETIVRLQPGSVWMQADVLCPGRTLRGERFAYRSCRNELTVHYGDELIYAQRQRIEPQQQILAAPGSWEEMTHTASFYVFSDRVDAGLLARLQETLDSYEAPAEHQVLAGASLTDTVLPCWRHQLPPGRCSS
jgi:urease accessory protein